MPKAALQLYSIRILMEQDPLGTLEEAAKAGYDGVEFSKFFDMPAEKIKDKLEETGLKACGTHTSWDDLNEKSEEIFKYYKTIGNQNIILPSTGTDYEEADLWVEAAHKFNELGKKCADNGFSFAYHNHAFEFRRFDGVTAYQILAENINPEYVKLQPDMGWISYADEDAMEFVKKYGHLVLTVHVKQFKRVGSRDSTEVHKGMVYYPPIIEAYKNIGVEWFIIEQEGFEISSLDSIKINCRELKKMF